MINEYDYSQIEILQTTIHKVMHSNFKNNRKHKVLIVDDIARNIQVLGNILGGKEMQIGFAMSGKQALQIVDSQEVDLVLLDIAMPEMDGYEVCRIMKTNPKTKHIPIIFLTAKVQPDDMIKGFEMGAVDYITKPFNPSVLLSRVFTHLELKRSRDELTNNINIIDKQNQQLTEINKTKDKLFSIISHDLRSPVGNVKSILEILARQEQFDSTSHHFIELASRASFLAFNLVENLLSWARTQMGKMVFKPQNIHIGLLIAENIELFSVIAKSKGLNINNLLNRKIYVYADDNMISTVIRNLLSNSIKFTNEGGTIDLDAEVIEEENSKNVRICIADNGIGISEENIPKLFSDNEYMSTYGTENEKGAGIGLGLCKEFTEKNGGKIWVESELGEGSSFYFTLPLGTNIENG